MCYEVVLSYVRRLVLPALCLAVLPIQAADVKLAWNASPSPNISSYILKYGTTSGSYPNTLTVGNSLTGTISNLTSGVRYYFVVTAKDTSGAESVPSNETSATSGSTTPNVAPVINPISNVSFNEDSSSQVVNLSGIGAGSNEVQTLTVTATSSNPTLIPNPAVGYTSPNTSGTLTLTPAANASGTATITVTVNDGQSQSSTTSRTFTVTVNAVNDPPSLNALSNMSLNLNAGSQTIALSGINSGAANESQTLTVTATHNNPALLGPLNVSYASPATSGTLTFTPLSGATGSAAITVRVQDDGTGANATTRTFNVTVSASSAHTIFAEAESGALVAPMASASDSRAFGGRYITSTVAEQGTASYVVNIPAAGNYRIWCRILSPNDFLDSFYVKVDSGTEDVYDTASGLWSSNWQWTVVNGRLTGNPRLFNLSQGTHTIVIRGREMTTGLDALYVTDDSNFVPPSVPPSGGPNQAPTLNTIANLSLQEDAGLQTVNLTGISSGATNENQTLTVTATSSNPALIPTPSVVYTSPNSTGSLRLTPAVNASGTANITVTVSDGQSQNSTLSRTFTVTVLGVNDAPVVNAGLDATVRLPALLSLSGSVTEDGLPNPPGRWTSTWSKVSGPGLVTFGVATNLLSSAGFTSAGQYVLRLTASDGALSSSDDLLVTVLPLIDVTGPVVSGLVSDGKDAQGFALRWQTDEPAVCQIEFGPTSSLGSATTLEASFSLAHQGSVTNLLSAKAYYYRIRSTDSAGNSSVTAVATLMTPVVNIVAWEAEDGLLTAPMSRGSNELAVQRTYISSSSANAGDASFPIEINVPSNYRMWCRLWSPAAGSGSFLVSVDGGPEDTFDTAESGWKNGWRWVAVNGRGGSAPLTLNPRLFNLNATTHEILFRTGEPSTLLDEVILSNDPSWIPDIHGVAPTLRATVFSASRIDLVWTDNTLDEQGFLLEVSTNGTFFAELTSTWGGVTNYQHTGIVPGITYYYRIFAFSDTDRTDYSPVINAQTSGTPPPAPTGLKAIAQSGGQIVLSWQDNSANETGFTVERSDDGANFTVIFSLGANVTSVSDTPPRRDRFYYRVRAYNSWGSSPYSNVDSARVGVR